MLKRISTFLGVISIILVYPIHYASASVLGDIVSGIFGIGSILPAAMADVVAFFINSVIGAIAKIFIWLAIALVNWGIDINHTIVSGNSLAHYGWGITLGIANLLIVIAIIVIAFGTMLRKSWGVKSLPRLITIALLINFSYWIAAELITIADNVTKAFLTMANKSMSWDTFATFFTTNIWDPNTWTISGAIGIAGSSFATLVSPMFAIAFTFVAFLSLLAIAATFFIRYIMLTILLMLLPVALATSLFSVKIGKGNAWEQWMGEFIKWLTFGPIMAFFIFLAFAVLNYPPTATPSFSVSMGNYIVIIGILIAGLKISHSMGIAAAGAAYGLAQKGGKWALSKGKQWGTRVATAPLRTEGGKKLTAALQAAPKWTGAPAAGYALNKFGAMGEKLVDEGKFKDLSSDRLAQMVPALSGPDRVAALSKLAKSGDLLKVRNLGSYLSEDNKAQFISYGKEFGDIEKGATIPLAAWLAFSGGDQVRAEEEMKKFYLGLTDKDRAKIPFNSIYGDYDTKNPEKNPFFATSPEELLRFRSLSTRSILANPGQLNKIAPKIKAKNFGNFLGDIMIESGVEVPGPLKTETVLPSGTIMKADANEVAKNMEAAVERLKAKAPRIHKAVSKTLAAYETGIGFHEEKEEEIKEEAAAEKPVDKEKK